MGFCGVGGESAAFSVQSLVPIASSSMYSLDSAQVRWAQWAFVGIVLLFVKRSGDEESLLKSPHYV